MFNKERIINMFNKEKIVSLILALNIFIAVLKGGWESLKVATIGIKK